MRSPKAPPAPDPKTQVSGIEEAAKRRTLLRLAQGRTGAGQTQLPERRPMRLLQPGPLPGHGAWFQASPQAGTKPTLG